MAKLTLATVVNPENDTSFASQINANFDLIETAIENTLSRDGTTPNTMSDELDVNNNKIVNVSDPTGANDAANKSYVDTVASTGAAGADGSDGTDGTDGDDGWAPILSVASDSDRRVLKLEDWTGGTGTKPGNVGEYISASGFDATIGNGVDIRGPQGTSGAGSGDLLASNNLSDVDNAGTSRTNLGVAIGTDVQAYDADLAALAGLTSAANKLPYFTGSATASLADLSSFGRTLIDDASASAARTTLGVAIGTDVQAYDAGLQSIAGLTTVADRYLYTTGADTYAVGTITSQGRAILDDADASAQRTTLGLTDPATASFASQAEAEAGTSTTRVMSPLRTAQAITALGSGLVEIDNQQPTSDVSEVILTGLSSYNFVVVMWSFGWASDNVGTDLLISFRTSAGTWRDLFDIDSGRNGIDFGYLICAQTGTAGAKFITGMHVSDSQVNIDASDAANSYTTDTDTFLHMYAHPTWAETWDEIRFKENNGSVDIEGSSADRRGRFIAYGI